MRSSIRPQAALEAGQPPDFLFGTSGERRVARWAYEDRLVDLEGVLGPVLDLFDADTIEVSTLLDGKTGRRGLYALPMGRHSNHVHVWNSLLERAGFTLADIPKQWEAFWSFWCDQVQPAVRKALGREDIWGVGLPMSAAASDTDDELLQFELAYGTPWLDRDRRLQIDDPAVRAGIIKALDAYTAIWRKGCTPPDSTSWTNLGNNKAFLAQTVVMTLNAIALDPGRAAHARGPTTTTRTPPPSTGRDGANGQPLVIDGGIYARRGLQGRRESRARRGLRPLSRRGRLARPLAGFRRRPLHAADAQAGRAAVLARPERPAPHARGNPDPDPATPDEHGRPRP